MVCAVPWLSPERWAPGDQAKVLLSGPVPVPHGISYPLR